MEFLNSRHFFLSLTQFTLCMSDFDDLVDLRVINNFRLTNLNNFDHMHRGREKNTPNWAAASQIQ